VLPSVVARFSSRQGWDLFHSGAGQGSQVFHPVFKVLHSQGEDRPPISGFPFEGSASPDGQFILFWQNDELGSDLMLVENFR
jgi:hypothetical protein